MSDSEQNTITANEEIAEYNEAQEENELEEIEAALILKEAERVYEQGKEFGKPSFFKYGVVLIPWAIVVDIVDALTLTGLGYYAAAIFSWFSWLAILFIIWFTNGSFKNVQDYNEKVTHAVEDLQKDLARLTRLGLKTSKLLRKVPGMKGIAKKIPRSLVKIRKVMRKNPLGKVLLGGALNLVPALNILNLLSIWVYLSYRDEKATFEAAQELGKEYLESVREIYS